MLDVIPNSQTTTFSLIRSAIDCQHQTQRKRSNVLLATMKNAQESTVWAVWVFTSWPRSKASVVTRNSTSKCFSVVIWLSYVIGFDCFWRRLGMTTDSRIHHVVSRNYFLAYSASVVQKYIPPVWSFIFEEERAVSRNGLVFNDVCISECQGTCTYDAVTN